MESGICPMGIGSKIRFDGKIHLPVTPKFKLKSEYVALKVRV
jgi:hypothetical protein